MTLLNDGYYNNVIKNTKTQSMISESTWYLGGYDDLYDIQYVDNIYGYERGSAKCLECTYNTTWTGKIALIYPSDYGYTMDLSRCNNQLKYLDDDCLDTNWLRHDDSWLLTPSSSFSTDVMYINSSGRVFLELSPNLDYLFDVIPTLYLNSDVVIESGTGAIGTPYVLR